MHENRRDIALAMGLLLAGCTGTYQRVGDPDRIPDDDGDREMTAARRAFEDDVVPILHDKCAGCHTAGAAGSQPKFLGDGESSYYDHILLYPSVTGDFDPGLAGVLTKIARGHYAVTYTDEQRHAIQDWIDAEALERGDGDGDGEVDQPPSVNPLAEWAGCMTFDDWVATGMGRWADKETEEDGPCMNCHADGLARFFASGESSEMFAMHRYELYIIGFFTVKVDPDGTQTVVPALGKLRRMGSGNFHPNYPTDEEADPQFAGLVEFHQLTMNRKASGQCGPAEFPAAPEI
jgi:mono/diheme cytochrome c family protein